MGKNPDSYSLWHILAHVARTMFKVLFMTHAPQGKSYRKLLARIETEWQHLSAAEISLQEIRAAKSINRDQFKKRNLKIQQMKHNLKAMKQQLIFEEQLRQQPEKFDLPNLETLRPLEHNAIEAFFNERFKVLHDTYQSLLDFIPWVEDANHRRGSYWSIFRLAKIKLFMGRLKSELKKVSLDIQLQEKLLTKIISMAGKTNNQDELLAQCIQCLKQQELTTDRVAKLEQKIQKKKQEIHYMKNWLAEERSTIRRKVPPGPPRVDLLTHINQDFDIFEVDKLNRSRERLDLAQTYIQSYIKKYAGWDDSIPKGE